MTEDLVSLVKKPSFTKRTLEDPETLLAWFCENAGIFDRAADNKPQLRSETGIGAFAGWADDQAELEAAFANERTAEWSLLGHGEQTFLYWDRSALPEPRVLELDHEQRMGDLMMHDWRGARALVLGLWARFAKVPGVSSRACACSLHPDR